MIYVQSEALLFVNERFVYQQHLVNLPTCLPLSCLACYICAEEGW